MKRTILIFTILFALLSVYQTANAQLDSTMQLCQSQMNLPFISDGQSYTALLNGDETAEFYATFYGESKYRIVAYSGTTEGNIIFSVYDQEFLRIPYDEAPWFSGVYYNRYF